MLPRRLAAAKAEEDRDAAEKADAAAVAETKDSVKEFLRTAEIEIAMGKQLAARLLEQMEKSGLVSSMATNGNRDLLAPKRDE